LYIFFTNFVEKDDDEEDEKGSEEEFDEEYGYTGLF
jgi:hypothetical protein